MDVSKLYVQDFRQFTQRTWDLAPGINLVVAPNGSGKTTLLEALHLLATGKSFRASKTVEMIRFGQEIARVYALTDDKIKLGMTLTGGFVGGQKAAAKYYQIDQTKKRAVDFVGNLLTATFRPEDLRLIEGSSARRRDYLDGPLSLVSQVYREAHKKYSAALVRRNKTLKAIRDEGLDESLLSLWDRQVLEFGPVVQRLRAAYVDFVNTQVQFARPYRLIYQHSLISPERLLSHRRAELAVGYTLVGPHKDDLLIEAKLGGQTVNLATYGSRGQQRLAVLWLKLAELEYIKQETKRVPILLLDDIFSELDSQARELVLAQVQQQTTIITSIDQELKKIIGKQVNTIVL